MGFYCFIKSGEIWSSLKENKASYGSGSLYDFLQPPHVDV